MPDELIPNPEYAVIEIAHPPSGSLESELEAIASTTNAGSELLFERRHGEWRCTFAMGRAVGLVDRDLDPELVRRLDDGVEVLEASGERSVVV